MQPSKKIVIVAGEESGDHHAAVVAIALQEKYPAIHISGIGGKHLREAGVELISDLAQFGVTGLSEVLRHALVIRRAYKAIKAHLRSQKPDLLILVDYPGFNLRLAHFAKKTLGIRTLYYISPQIWAWKANRIHTIRASVDHMAVIFPFEKQLYKAAGVPVSFVGHPLINTMPSPYDKQATRERLHLPKQKRLIALLPGSRQNEIERHMPVLSESAARLCDQFDDLHFIIPVAATIQSDCIHAYFANKNVPYTLIQGRAVETMNCSDCVVVASGTASLECALLEKPMCIIYKASPLTYLAARLLMQVKYLGLCNLLEQKMIVPELLQYDCNAIELTRTLTTLLTNAIYCARMQSNLRAMKESLRAEQADKTLIVLIEEILDMNLRIDD